MSAVEQVPDWAIEKALALMEYGGTPLAKVIAEPNEHYEVIAFARYISGHEEEPADPLMAEAEALYQRWLVDEVGGTSTVDVVLAALKRGIELAKSGEVS